MSFGTYIICGICIFFQPKWLGCVQLGRKLVDKMALPIILLSQICHLKICISPHFASGQWLWEGVLVTSLATCTRRWLLSRSLLKLLLGTWTSHWKSHGYNKIWRANGPYLAKTAVIGDLNIIKNWKLKCFLFRVANFVDHSDLPLTEFFGSGFCKGWPGGPLTSPNLQQKSTESNLGYFTLFTTKKYNWWPNPFCTMLANKPSLFTTWHQPITLSENMFVCCITPLYFPRGLFLMSHL